MNKYIAALVLTVLISTSAFAGNMRDWVESVYPKINTPLIDTLEINRYGQTLIGDLREDDIKDVRA